MFMEGGTRLSLIVGVILVFAILVFGVLASQIFNRLSDNENNLAALKTLVSNQGSSFNNQIGSLDTQIAALSNQINSSTAQTAAMNAQLTSAAAQISALGTQLTAATGQVTALKTQIGAYDAQFSSLNAQILVLSQNITSLDSNNKDLQSQFAAANNQITALKTQVTTLSTQQSTPTTPTTPTQVTLFSGQQITVPGGQQVSITSFNSQAAGNLYVSGTTSSTTGYLRLNNSIYASNVIYPFSGSPVTLPVQPTGFNTLYFGNNDTAGTSATATLNAYVNYSGSSSQTLVVSSKYFSIAGGQQASLATFTADYQGNIYINGTTTSNTGFIQVYNPSYGTSSNYPFSNNALLTIPVQVGQNTVTFGCSDAASVTVTGTLSISYNH